MSSFLSDQFAASSSFQKLKIDHCYFYIVYLLVSSLIQKLIRTRPLERPSWWLLYATLSEQASSSALYLPAIDELKWLIAPEVNDRWWMFQLAVEQLQFAGQEAIRCMTLTIQDMWHTRYCLPLAESRTKLWNRNNCLLMLLKVLEKIFRSPWDWYNSLIILYYC